MKSLRTIGLIALAACVGASAAMAAPTIGIYFDDQASSSSTRVRSWEKFNIYVVMSAIEDQVTGTEYKLNLPPEIVVLNRDYWGGNPILIGSPSDGYMVGFGDCIPVYEALPGNEKLIVETLEVMAVNNLKAGAITLTKFEGGTEAPQVSAPRYSNCDDQVFEMNVVNATLAAGNPTIGVYFDEQRVSSDLSVRPYEAFNIYVVLSDIEDRVTAVEYKLNLPSDLVVSGRNYWGDPILIGNPADGYVVGLGECVTVSSQIAGSETLVIESIQAFAFQNFDTQPITLTKFEGGSEGPLVNGPRYANCDDQVYEMSPVNATIEAPVAGETTSWGAVKALYNE